MPPRDPRLCPALEAALPAGSPGSAGGYRPDRSRWLVLFGDGEEHPVTARGWWTDRHGRAVVQVEWSIATETWGGAHLFDAELMREG